MIKSIKSVKVSGRRVVVRCGFDVPLKKNNHSEEWEVVDENRIKDSLATLKYLIAEGAKIVIISHLSRPEGKWNEEKSLWPIAQALGRLLFYKTTKISDSLQEYNVPHLNFLTSDITKQDLSGLSKKLKPGDILMLENIRFYPGEEKSSKEFISTLSSYGDVFVNEAFSVAHRKEASTYGLAETLPAYAGLSFAKEIQALNKVSRQPEHPLIVVMGGVKISDKIDTIHSLAKHAQHILIGGALANSFLKAAGYEIGKSKFSDLNLAKELLRNYKAKIVLPVDCVVGKSVEDKMLRAVSIDKIKPTDTIYDVGPETVRKFSGFIKTAKTLIWNGPMGLIEYPRFAFGSLSIARVVASRSSGRAYGVVGGGETVEVVDQAKVSEYIDHISTGGGAMLEYLAGKTLPAIKVLDK